MFYDNVGPLIEILYSDLLDLNGGIPKLDREKFVG